MCGITGIYSHDPVAPELYDSLIHLQHRGQDAAGMITSSGKFHVKHGTGYVREIFSARDIENLRGNTGIAHVRYPTAGGSEPEDVQPLWTGSPRGIALAHNGNLVNYAALSEEMTRIKHRHLNSSTDSEVLLHLLAEGVEASHETDVFAQICSAVQHVFDRAQGSFSVVSQIIGKGLLVFRDPHGIRPLACGIRTRADGTKDYIFSSETTMFAALGFDSAGDVAPGEVIFVNTDGELFRKNILKKSFSPCIFEYVYFARPDTTLDQISVYETRLKMGEKLAREWQKNYPDILPDVIVPAPFTSNTAAIAFAQTLGVRYAEGLYKNAFIGRTFIMPDGQSRSRNVRYKLMPQKTELNNKRVLILDDSIVRGTTSREIVRLVREAGAKEIYFVSACPPVRHPCFYGIAMPSSEELIAANKNNEEIREFLGVDILLYQTQKDLMDSICLEKAAFTHPCMACLDGNYVAGKMA